MSYKNFMEKLESGGKSVKKFEEDVEIWRKMSATEKAEAIQEAKADEDSKKYILEVAEAAGKEAGGAGDETGDEILSKGAGEPKEATNMSDEDARMSDKGKIASAAGIAQGLGALNLAKKLRREQVSTPSGE